MVIDPITAVLDVGKVLIERVWPNPLDQAREIRLLEELHQKGELAELSAKVEAMKGQLEINKTEASHKSVFVAGWRPFVGWVCGFGLLYATITEPIMRFVAAMLGYKGDFPIIDTTLTMQVLIGMLGLVASRTREKEKGVHKDTLN